MGHFCMWNNGGRREEEEQTTVGGIFLELSPKMQRQCLPFWRSCLLLWRHFQLMWRCCLLLERYCLLFGSYCLLFGRYCLLILERLYLVPIDENSSQYLLLSLKKRNNPGAGKVVEPGSLCETPSLFSSAIFCLNLPATMATSSLFPPRVLVVSSSSSLVEQRWCTLRNSYLPGKKGTEKRRHFSSRHDHSTNS